MPEDLSAHKITLARELLDDIELSRMMPDQLLLKTTRLARLVEADEIERWLRFEMRGYPGDNPVSLKYMDITGRWTEKEKKLGYWQSLAEINGHVAAMELQVRNLKVPDIHFAPSSSNPHEIVAGFGGAHVNKVTGVADSVLARMQSLTSQIGQLSGIRSRVLSLVHDFVSKTYYTLAFSGLAETVFEKHKKSVDELLRKTAGDALEKIPAIYKDFLQGIGKQ